jgi:outer membrane protein assembly factor BamC
MQQFPNPFRIAGAVLLTVVLGACSTITGPDGLLPDRRVEYKQSRSIDPLEVPPDLTSSSIEDGMAVPDLAPSASATFSEYAGGRAVQGPRAEPVLATYENLRIARDGHARWLVVQASPEVVWPKVRDFWLQQGFLVAQEDPQVGVLETEWAENRGDIPQDAVRRVLSKVIDSLYSAATRDKYRVRLERGTEPGTTEIYLAHRGAEEVVQGESTMWQTRPADPELEAEMLHRLMVHLGVEEQRSRTMLAERGPERAPRAQLTQDAEGNPALTLDEEFFRAWRRTGLALDRVGFTVEDRDRSEGVYFVRYNDPLREQPKKGFFSRMFKRGEEPASNEYRVGVIDEGATTRVVVLDREGNREKTRTGLRILTLLHEQLQ